MCVLRSAWLFVCLFVMTSLATAGESVDVRVVAHRGLLRHAPENTLANFRACLELRLGFEFDVQRSQDGHLVCIHDDTVDRTTDGVGKVSEMTLRSLRQLDAGRWFGREFAGEKVPTVDEVLQLVAEYREHDVLIAVDLKAAGVGPSVVRLAKQRGVLGRLIFIGRAISDPDVRRRLAETSAAAQIAAVANDALEFPRALGARHAAWVYFRFLPTAQQMDAVGKANKRAFIAGSTVSGNTPQNWGRAAGVGVNGILTDYPLELRTQLRKNP